MINYWILEVFECVCMDFFYIEKWLLCNNYFFITFFFTFCLALQLVNYSTDLITGGEVSFNTKFYL